MDWFSLMVCGLPLAYFLLGIAYDFIVTRGCTGVVLGTVVSSKRTHLPGKSVSYRWTYVLRYIHDGQEYETETLLEGTVRWQEGDQVLLMVDPEYPGRQYSPEIRRKSVRSKIVAIIVWIALLACVKLFA